MKHTYKIFAALISLGLASVFAQPVIDTEPVADTVVETESAQFTVTATADSGVLTYQWQDSPDDAAWTDRADDTLATLDIASAALADSGKYFRVVVTDSAGSDTSVSVQLIVNAITAPVVDSDPTDSTVTEGEPVSFTAAASGASQVLQWQKDSLADGSWADITGADALTYSITTSAIEDNGSLYRMIVSNAGGSDTSASAALTVNAAPPFSNWTSSISFLISTDSNWANISTDVHNFPVLIRVDDSQFDFSLVKAGGADIRMATSDDVALPYELEYWDETAGMGAIWVLLDTLAGNSSRTVKMYYGNAAAEDGSNSLAVFDTANGFAGVWHLSEAGNVDSAGYADATANGNHCTGVSLDASSSAAGAIGMGAVLDGAADYLGCGTDSSLNITEALTLCSWVNATNTTGSWTGIISKDRPDENGYWLMENNTSVLFEINNEGAWIKTAIPYPAAERGSWQHVCGVFDGANLIGYKNGVETGRVAQTTPITSSANELRIGDSNIFDRFFEGALDEVRVSGVARSAAWIELSHANQSAANSLVSSPIIPGCVPAFTVAADTVSIAEGTAGAVSGTATCALRSEWVHEDGSFLGSGSSIDVTVGRISADSTFTVSYRALFDVDSAWQTRVVTVNIIENIPDPAFTLAGIGQVWDGNEDIAMTPFVSNMSAILASPAPYNTVNYAWTTSGITVSKTGTTTSTMTMTRAYGDGTFEVRLCLNNGGASICDTVEVEVLRPVGVQSLQNPLQPIQLQSGMLIWNSHASIHIWDLDGTLLFEETGRPGNRVQLQQNLITGFDHKRYYVRITNFDKTEP